jgi:hypothetical protein
MCASVGFRFCISEAGEGGARCHTIRQRRQDLDQPRRFPNRNFSRSRSIHFSSSFHTTSSQINIFYRSVVILNHAQLKIRRTPNRKSTQPRIEQNGLTFDIAQTWCKRFNRLPHNWRSQQASPKARDFPPLPWPTKLTARRPKKDCARPIRAKRRKCAEYGCKDLVSRDADGPLCRHREYIPLDTITGY